MFEQLANMKKSMEMYEEMQSMMQMFSQFSAGSSEEGADGSAAFGDGNDFSESAGSDPADFANPMEILKGMLSPEQQAMFEMFQSASQT